MAKFKTQKGVTLIETLLYLAIAGSLLLVVSLFLSLLLEARVKNQTMAEVEQQGDFIMRTMLSSIANAQSLNLPGPGGEDTSLSLAVSDNTLNPTVFSFSLGGLTETQGSNAALDLLSTQVKTSNENFSNFMVSGSGGSVQIKFTLSYNNQTGRNEYSYSQNFEGAATIRK